jgi:hypothetical protein
VKGQPASYISCSGEFNLDQVHSIGELSFRDAQIPRAEGDFMAGKPWMKTVKIGDREVMVRTPTPTKFMDYSREQIEFMAAMRTEQEQLVVTALTPAQILRVARRIGYRRVIDLAEVGAKR